MQLTPSEHLDFTFYLTFGEVYSDLDTSSELVTEVEVKLKSIIFEKLLEI